MLFQCWPTRWANIETALGGCPLFAGSCLIMRGQLAVGLPVTAYFSGEQLPPFGFVHTSKGRPVYARLTFGTLRSILKQDMTCQVSNCNEVIKGSSEVMWCSKTNIQPIKYEVGSTKDTSSSILGSTMSIDPILSPMLDQLLPLGRWFSIQLIVTVRSAKALHNGERFPMQRNKILWHLSYSKAWLARPCAVFSYKLRYIVGLWLVEMAISTNHKPTIYRNLYENTGPVVYVG